MHVAAWICGHLFFLISKYIFSSSSETVLNILDVGSADVNGNLKDALYTSKFNDLKYNYVGLDVDESSLNVDVVVKPGQYPLNWPFEKEYFDIIVSSSCLEHDDFYWETFSHMVEKLKPGGLIYLSLPNKVDIHRYPVDNWRFLPDAAYALAQWSNRYHKDTDMNIHVLFSEIIPNNDHELDTVMIFYKSDSVPLVNNIFQSVYYQHYILNRLRFAHIHNISFSNEFFNKIPIDIRKQHVRMDHKSGTPPSGTGTGLDMDHHMNMINQHHLDTELNMDIYSDLVMSEEMLENLENNYMTWNAHCRAPYTQKQFTEPIESYRYPYVSYTLTLGKPTCMIEYTLIFNEKDFQNETYVEDSWNVIIKKAHLDPVLITQFIETTTSMLPILQEDFYQKYSDIIEK